MSIKKQDTNSETWIQDDLKWPGGRGTVMGSVCPPANGGKKVHLLVSVHLRKWMSNTVNGEWWCVIWRRCGLIVLLVLNNSILYNSILHNVNYIVMPNTFRLDSFSCCKFAKGFSVYFCTSGKEFERIVLMWFMLFWHFSMCYYLHHNFSMY